MNVRDLLRPARGTALAALAALLLAACGGPAADASADHGGPTADASGDHGGTQTLAAAEAPRSTVVEAAAPGDGPVMKIYKTPTCGCCANWVEHVKQAGFRVKVHDMDDVAPIKREHGLPGQLASCHTGVVDGYVVEGHVPAEVIRRMLREKPAIAGIAVPGMPSGSPGMEMPGAPADPYDIVAFTKDGGTRVFESRR